MNVQVVCMYVSMYVSMCVVDFKRGRKMRGQSGLISTGHHFGRHLVSYNGWFQLTCLANTEDDRGETMA